MLSKVYYDFAGAESNHYGEYVVYANDFVRIPDDTGIVYIS